MVLANHRYEKSARILVGLSWILGLTLFAGWLFVSGGSLYNSSAKTVYYFARLAPLVLIGLVVAKTSLGREPKTRRVALVIAGLGLGLVHALGYADSLTLGLVERIYFPPENRFCSFIPAVAPAFCYTSIGWVAVVVRGQAELVSLIHEGQLSSWERLGHRLFRLGLGLGLTVMIAELALFLGACNYRAVPVELAWWQPDFAAHLAMTTPILALLVWELWLRRERGISARAALTRGPGPAPAQLRIRDPLALRRAHISKWVGRGVVVAIVVASLPSLRDVLYQTLLERPAHWGWLLAGGLALLSSLVVVAARWPETEPVDAAWTDAVWTDEASSPRLRALVEAVERFRVRLEHERLGRLWRSAVEITTAIDELDERERRRLAERGVDLDALARALRQFGLLALPAHAPQVCRRAIYIELTRFCARVRGSTTVDPFRNTERGAEPPALAWLASQPARGLVSGYSIAAGLGLCVWLGTLASVELGGLVTLEYAGTVAGTWLTLVLAALAGPVAYALARADVRGAEAQARPQPAPEQDPDAVVASTGSRSRNIAIASTLAGLALGLTIPLIGVRPPIMIGEWSWAQPNTHLSELALIVPLVSLGLLLAVLVRASLVARAYSNTRLRTMPASLVRASTLDPSPLP